MDADDLERVARALAPHGELVETRSLAGGVSTGATVVEVRSAAGALRRLVVREHRRAAAEFRLLRLLWERGFPVPEPVLLAGPIVVTGFLEHDAWPTEVAPGAQLAFLPSLPGGANAEVLLHGDFWPGNVLWRDGAPVAVVDWEEAVLGDPLADVGNCRFELLWALGAEAVDEFTGAYRDLAPELDYGDLPAWDVRAVDRLLPFVHLFDPGEERQAEMRSLANAFRSRARERLSSR